MTTQKLLAVGVSTLLTLKQKTCPKIHWWQTWLNSKIQTSFNAKNHHQNQRHFGAPSIDFSWHIRISGLPDSLGNIFIKWKIFLNLFQKNLFLQKINIWLRYCPTKMAASRATKSYFESFRFYYTFQYRRLWSWQNKSTNRSKQNWWTSKNIAI